MQTLMNADVVERERDARINHRIFMLGAMFALPAAIGSFFWPIGIAWWFLGIAVAVTAPEQLFGVVFLSTLAGTYVFAVLFLWLGMRWAEKRMFRRRS